MDDLFNRVDEVDMKKVLRTAATSAAIGGAAMFGASRIPDSPSKHVPSAVQTTRDVRKGPEVKGTAVDNEGSSVAVGTSKINIDKIWQIESSRGKDPNMGRSRAGARGHFQFMKATWDEMAEKMGVDWDWRDGSMDYEKSSKVADYYLNTEIPRLLSHYKIEDTVENRLAAYNWGIGAVRKAIKKHGTKRWFEHSPKDTTDYIKKYRDMRESSIDFPRPGLDKQVWQKVDKGYSLRSDVKLHILQLIGRYPNENLRAIARSIRIVGSICTNLYTETVDIDVHIVPKEIDKYTLEGQVSIMKWFNEHRDEINGWIGQHPIEVYLQLDPVQDLLSDGCYDMLTGVWHKGPKIVPMNYDPYINFADIADEIRDQVSGADELLGELKRDAIDYDVIKAALSNIPPEYRKGLLTKLTLKLKEIEDGIESLYSKRREWTKIRRDSSKPSTPEEALKDVELVRKWASANATFKFLSRYKYMRVIKDLADLLDDDKISPEEVDKVKDLVGAA